MELVSGRLRLRNVVPSDAEGPYLTWVNDPDVTRYLDSPSGHTAPSLREYVRDTGSRPDTWFLAIELHAGRHIGNIKLGPVDQHHRRAPIGILIGDRTCWGRGYATEAISLVADGAFRDLGLHKLTAGAWEANRGSVRAFEKAGFHVEAVCREHFRSDEGWSNLVLLARFADDGSAATAG